MPTLITIISTLAVVVGIVGIVPQLITMLRTGSAGGQSTLGWALAAGADLALAFVNALGYHAIVLAAGNVLGLLGCLLAVWLVRRYRDAEPATGAGRVAPDVVAEMHTQEFVVLREAVLAEHHRRTGEPVLAF